MLCCVTSVKLEQGKFAFWESRPNGMSGHHIHFHLVVGHHSDLLDKVSDIPHSL